MPIEKLKKSVRSLHSHTPEGRHTHYRIGTPEEKAVLKAAVKSETDEAVRQVRREQLAHFIVVSPEHAERHAKTIERKTRLADSLIASLGLTGKGKPGVIAEGDARRYLVKTFREIRHQIAAGGTPNLADLSKAVALHLGTENLSLVQSALSSEVSAFSSEHAAALAELGEHHSFHEDLGFHDARLQS